MAGLGFNIQFLPLQVTEAMSDDATADADAGNGRRRLSRSAPESTSGDSRDNCDAQDSDSAGEQVGVVKGPLAAALEAAAEPPAGRCLCPVTAACVPTL